MKESIKEFSKKYLYNYYFLCIASAFVVNLLIECFSRHSIGDAFSYMIQSPIVFIYNSLLILLTLSVTLLVRRKMFMLTTISLIWLTGGITNGIVLNNRVTPFTANELKLISSTFDILQKYFTKFEMGLIIVGIAVALIGVVIAFFKAPKSKNKVNYKRNIPIFFSRDCKFSTFNTGCVKNKYYFKLFWKYCFCLSRLWIPILLY